MGQRVSMAPKLTVTSLGVDAIDGTITNHEQSEQEDGQPVQREPQAVNSPGPAPHLGPVPEPDAPGPAPVPAQARAPEPAQIFQIVRARAPEPARVPGPAPGPAPAPVAEPGPVPGLEAGPNPAPPLQADEPSTSSSVIKIVDASKPTPYSRPQGAPLPKVNNFFK
uniref:Uncharacterized protein n=1 Tax=Caenorhabditis japonica TaxID=281687 RepID=A0A8R1E457_CAEJA